MFDFNFGPKLLVLTFFLSNAWVSAYGSPLQFSFQTIPVDGNISGEPGSTVGWGYKITNEDTSAWLVTTDVVADIFIVGLPDATYFDFPVIAPQQTVSIPFSDSLHTGLYGVGFSQSDPVGVTDTGQFTILAEWWTKDPSLGGTFLESAGSGSVPYAAQVVPEPRPRWLILGGFAMTLGLRLCRLGNGSRWMA